MKTSKLKNMVVLNNFPSNIVDEAIIVLKNGARVKDFQVIEKNGNNNSKDNGKSENYILKEAEMLLNRYINKVDNKDIKQNKKLEKKYNKLKIYSVVVTIIAVLGIVIWNFKQIWSHICFFYSTQL